MQREHQTDKSRTLILLFIVNNLVSFITQNFEVMFYAPNFNMSKYMSQESPQKFLGPLGPVSHFSVKANFLKFLPSKNLRLFIKIQGVLLLLMDLWMTKEGCIRHLICILYPLLIFGSTFVK